MSDKVHTLALSNFKKHIEFNLSTQNFQLNPICGLSIEVQPKEERL